MLTVITLVQIMVYEKGDQRFSLFAIVLVIVLTLGLVVFAGIVAGGVASTWLKLLTTIGWCKVGISLLKYMPQAYMNCIRGTTDGFNVYNVLLDFTGGAFNVTQQVIPCILTGSWEGIAGNSAKFGLGMASMVFDTIFATQHYILYTRKNELYTFARSASGLMKPSDKAAVLGLMARDRMDDLKASGLLAAYVRPGQGGEVGGYGSGAVEGEEGGLSPGGGSAGEQDGSLLGGFGGLGTGRAGGRLDGNESKVNSFGSGSSRGARREGDIGLSIGGTGRASAGYSEGVPSSLDSLEESGLRLDGGRPFR